MKARARVRLPRPVVHALFDRVDFDVILYQGIGLVYQVLPASFVFDESDTEHDVLVVVVVDRASLGCIEWAIRRIPRIDGDARGYICGFEGADRVRRAFWSTPAGDVRRAADEIARIITMRAKGVRA